MADLLAVRNSWVYVCQPTGTGKTTEMLELGYMMGRLLRPATGNREVNVRLIVPSPEQATLYKKRFAEKESQAETRINFIWQPLKEFLQQWIENPSQFNKDVLVADEGDQLLIRQVTHKETSAWPKRWVLLSALSRDQWSETQKICFKTNKSTYQGIYVDVGAVFPPERGTCQRDHPEILPSDPEDLVKFAADRA